MPESKELRAIVRSEIDHKVAAKLKKPSKVYTFSHMVMGAIVLMFFVGVAVAGYTVILRGEPLSAMLDYIMKLAFPVSMGYFGKAFGENALKIILSAIYGNRLPDTANSVSNEDLGGTAG